LQAHFRAGLTRRDGQGFADAAEVAIRRFAVGEGEGKEEIVNARTNGAVRVGEFDLGGRVRIKWDGKGDIEIIKE